MGNVRWNEVCKVFEVEWDVKFVKPLSVLGELRTSRLKHFDGEHHSCMGRAPNYYILH